MVFSSPSYAADVNVLVLGAESGRGDANNQFNPTAIRTELENILNGKAGVGTVTVHLEDYGVMRTARVDDEENPQYTEKANLLMWYYEAYPLGLERDIRWPNLRGEGQRPEDKDWDYVVIIGNPDTIERMPGIYAYGVSKICKLVVEGGAEPILLMPWPSSASSSTLDYYREVVYRVGRSGGHKVAPAALAWQAAGSPAGTDHPNAQGAYIAAASVYSTMYDESASASSYTNNDTHANLANQTLQDNKNVEQYSGPFVDPNGYFSPFGNQDRFINISRTLNSSTENGYMGGGENAVHRAGAIDVDYWPGDVSGAETYEVTRSMGLGPNSLPFDHVMTERYYVGTAYLYMEWDTMMNQYDNYGTSRYLPWRTVFSGAWEKHPNIEPSTDGTHPSGVITHGCGTYIYQLISGRCGVDPRPATPSPIWDATLTGYEFAWMASRCQSRAPGYKVMPSSTTVGFTSPEQVEVRFILPPRTNVTVEVAASLPGITATPATLTFTPENYDQPQYVSLLAQEGMVPGTPFTVSFDTSSDDEVYDGLNDTWPYTVSTAPVARSQSLIVFQGKETPITLTGSDVDHDPLTFHIVDEPAYGTLKLIGDVATYVPHEGFLGKDSFTFKANDGNDDSPFATVEIEVFPQTVYGFNLLVNGSAELSPFSDYQWVEKTGKWTQKPSTIDGSYSFISEQNDGLAELYQDVDLSEYAGRIDYGDMTFRMSGVFIRRDNQSVILTFYDAGGNPVGTPAEISTSDSGTVPFSTDVLAPVGARSVRVLLLGRDGGDVGQVATGQYDALELIALEPETKLAPTVENDRFTVSSEIPNTFSLNAVDLDRDELTYIIESQSAHGTVTLVDGGPQFIYQTTGAYTGPDSFTFKVFDGKFYSNIATITLDVVENQAPVISLDSPATLDSALTSNLGIILETTVSDDGKPGALTLTWSTVSGPGDVIFTDPNSDDTGAIAGGGTYVVRLTADDGQLTTELDITIRMGVYDTNYPRNIGPYNQSGTSYIGNTGVALSLDGASAIDFEEGSPITTLWRQVSGPSQVEFFDPTDMHTAAVFDTPGEYVLRFIASDGDIQSFTDATVTITSIVGNEQPTVPAETTLSVADNSIDNPITLTGTDPEGQPLSYRIVDRPANGTIKGTPPNLTYTPAFKFVGTDSFTYRVNDGVMDSKLGTVVIDVDNTPPDVNAREDRSLTLASASAVAGAYSEWDASKDTDGDNVWESTGTSTAINWGFDGGSLSPVEVEDLRMQTLTHAYEFPAAQDASGQRWDSHGNTEPASLEFVIDVDDPNGLIFFTGSPSEGTRLMLADGVLWFSVTTTSNQTATSYTLSDEDMGRFIHVLAVLDQNRDKMELYVDGELKSSKAWAGSDFSPGGPNSKSTLGKFTGNIALFRYYRNTSFSGADVANNFLSLINGKMATTTIEGLASDVDGDDLTYSWSVVDVPQGGHARVGSPSALITDAGFTYPGTYTLRLTADDGSLQGSDDIVITVNHSAGSYTLNYTAQDGGTLSGFTPQFVDEGGSGSAVSAVARTGYNFVQWSDGVTTATRTDTNVTADLYVEAQFDPDVFTLTYAAGPNGSIIGDSSQNVIYSASGTAVSAVPASGYVFVDWSDGSTDNPRTDSNVTSNISVTANFIVDTRVTLTYTAGSGGIIIGESSQTIENGASGSAVSAVPDSGYIFVNWSDGSFENPRTDTNVTSDISVTANFSSGRFWKPEDISLHAWYDASDDTTITAGTSTGNVSAWADKSSNGRDLTGGDTPKTGQRSINGLNVMDMVGRSHFSRAAFPLPASGNLSVFMVTKVDSVNNFDDNLFTVLAGSRIVEFAPGSATQFNGAIQTSSMAGLSASLSGGPYDGVHLMSTSFNYDAGTLDVHVDGTNRANSLAYSSKIPSSTDWFYLFRGTAGSASRNAPVGAIAEVILVEDVTTETRQRIEGYLAHKWGQKDSLPEDHPYKDAPPITGGEIGNSYDSWATMYNLGTQSGMGDNPDGDRSSNMMEFAFGTDPTLSDTGPLATDGTRHGVPVLQEKTGGDGFELYFVRRDDHGTPGSLTYTACFSSDLATFYDDDTVPTVVYDSSVDSDYELVKVPFPASLPNGLPARFGYIRVEENP